MAGRGIGSFGEGFAEGFGVGERAQYMRADTKRKDDEGARARQKFDREEADIKANREDGEALLPFMQELMGGGQQQEAAPPQPGVQMQPPPQDAASMGGNLATQAAGPVPPQAVGPPQADGTPAAAPAMGVVPPGGPAPAPQGKSLLAAQDAISKYMKNTAPIYARILMRADPKAGAEYAAKLGDVKMQQKMGEELVIAKVLLDNANSEEGRAAASRFVENMPGGRVMDPESYTVMGNGTIKFHTFDPRDPQGSRQPELMEPARIQAMLMRALKPDQIAAELRSAKELGLKTKETDAKIKHYEEDTKIDRERLGIQRGESSERRADARRQRGWEHEDRVAALAARERNQVLDGIDGVLLGDKKTFADRPEEQKQQILGLRGSALSVYANNPEVFKGKGADSGGLALDVANTIANGGKGVKVKETDGDPQNVYVEIGGTAYKLPKSSYVVQQLLSKAQKRPPAGAAPAGRYGVQ